MARPQKKAPVAPIKTVENSEQHESLCNHCGKCCYQKIIVGRTVYITPFPCHYLDTHTNMCTVYDRRHELNPACLSIETGMKHSAFPLDCGYVKESAPKNYKPAREDYDWEAEWDEIDEIAEDLEVPPEIADVIRARGPNARPMYDEAFERIQATPTLIDLIKAKKDPLRDKP